MFRIGLKRNPERPRRTLDSLGRRPPVAVRPPVDPARRPTAIPSLDGLYLTVVEQPRAEFDLVIAEGDTAFCSVGFRMFLVGALAEMDAVMRQGVRYRAGLRQAANAHKAEQWARRSARNQEAAAYAVGGLTPSTAPRIAHTIVARALHASDAAADTGLLPAVVA